MKMIVAVLLLSSCGCWLTAEALKCFNCTSTASDRACSQPSDNATYVVTCDDTVTSCSAHIDYTSGNSGSKTVTRRCGLNQLGGFLSQRVCGRDFCNNEPVLELELGSRPRSGATSHVGLSTHFKAYIFLHVMLVMASTFVRWSHI